MKIQHAEEAISDFNSVITWDDWKERFDYHIELLLSAPFRTFLPDAIAIRPALRLLEWMVEKVDKHGLHTAFANVIFPWYIRKCDQDRLGLLFASAVCTR